MGFLSLVLSFLLGFLFVYWLFRIGLGSFQGALFLKQNIFEPVGMKPYFIAAVAIAQIGLLFFYGKKLINNETSAVKILKLSLIPLILFLFITFCNVSTYWFPYFIMLIFSFNLCFLIGLLGINYLEKITQNKRFDRWTIILIVIFAVLYALLSILRHQHFGSHAYDLGIFSQVVYNYSHFGAGDCTIRGVSNILADHFSPILIFLALLYLYP